MTVAPVDATPEEIDAVVRLVVEDEFDQQVYLHGSCHVLALALHERFGLPLVAIWDPGSDEAIDGFEGALVHFLVGDLEADEPRVVDALGERSLADVGSTYGSIDDFVVTGSTRDEVLYLSGPHHDEVDDLGRRLVEALEARRSVRPGM